MPNTIAPECTDIFCKDPQLLAITEFTSANQGSGLRIRSGSLSAGNTSINNSIPNSLNGDIFGCGVGVLSTTGTWSGCLEYSGTAFSNILNQSTDLEIDIVAPSGTSGGKRYILSGYSGNIQTFSMYIPEYSMS